MRKWLFLTKEFAMQKSYQALMITALAAALVTACADDPPAAPGADASTPYAYVPDTVSPEVAALLRSMPNPNLAPPTPQPEDIEGWKAAQAVTEARNTKMSQTILDRLDPEVIETEMGGVPVHDIRPRDWQDNGKILVYTHGGAYTFNSARSLVGSAALMANATGLRVISVDYTLAPHAKWRAIHDEVTAVFEGLLAEGFDMDDLAIYGDSAGGGLAAGAVLKMRDEDMGMPAAVVLWSPWSDITETGDTYTTLKDDEPFYTYERHLANSAAAYADPADQKHPYVSPVYGDYSKGYPPTLIQGGTKELLLSNMVRHYQALDTAGQVVKLDLYEGVMHVHQLFAAGSPESELALKKSAEFIHEYLD